MNDPREGSPGHLDLDALADALAGDLPPRGAAARHLRGCASCTSRVGELAAGEVAVAASLATLPAPPLPDGLSDRVAAALRAEASRAVGSPSAAEGPRRAPVRRLPRRGRPWLPSVAAAGALVLAGGLGWSVVQGGTGSGGGAGGHAASGGGVADQADELAGVPRSSTGADYADDRRRTAALRQVLSRTGGAAASGAGGASRTEAAVLDRLREPGPLRACLAGIRSSVPGAGPVLALDDARFGSGPALVVVLSDADPARLSLRVVGPGCTRADPELLLATRVVRPR